MSPSNLRVLYEDPFLIAVDKPVGQLVIPGRGDIAGKPLVAEVTRYLSKKAFVVHRIDRETSGLVVFAKDAATHKVLSVLWEAREVKKTYLTWVIGYLDKAEGLLDYPIQTFGSGRMGVGPQGKPSQTRYKTLKTDNGNTLLEVELLTGRRHQARVHLYQLGHPILGDTLYGQERPVGARPRLLLHSYKLRFNHEGIELNLTCEPPENFHT